jgi:tetratricopeptide (TPR) repeat protein
MNPIPDYLVGQIQAGRVVIFLGSGASLGASDGRGTHAPSTTKLGELLSDKFLGGMHKGANLAKIGDLAKSESDLFTLQEFLRSLFVDLIPTPAHETLTTFRWTAIATTNYDDLIEKAYRASKNKVQSPVPFISNNDRVGELMRDPFSVKLLKLHGCITRINDKDCPLILSTDQYVQYKQGRIRLFKQLEDYGCEYSILFIGSSIDDPDLRALLLELAQLTESRQRFYVVAPDIDDMTRRFWESSHRVAAINATFAEFFDSLSTTLATPFRGLVTPVVNPDFPISERFTKRDAELSKACQHFLTTDIEYVKRAVPTVTISPRDFYRGLNEGWSPIDQNLDVRRNLVDAMLQDVFLLEEEGRSPFELYVVRAHAGAGKSVFLRRLAWEASREFNQLCLYLTPHGVISAVALQELTLLCKERIYLFVDDVADRVREIESLAKYAIADHAQITVIAGERINEWNVLCQPIEGRVTEFRELRNLAEGEVDSLLSLLERHRSLGTLEKLSVSERKEAFAQRAGRQLLVALHEATFGKPFEDIIEDEFARIVPAEAQQLYLTICVLNRLGVPVRAGLIGRIYSIYFEDFKQRLFLPLEKVVHATDDPVLRDYVYRARHPHIAEIVFERVLRTEDQRFTEYVKVLRHLNPAYAPDEKALRGLMRGRNILELFPSHDLASQLYDIVNESTGIDAGLLHQEAIYEMNRYGGDPKDALALLSHAAETRPNDRTIQHSFAECFIKLADRSRTSLEKEHYRSEAERYCMQLTGKTADTSYGYHTLLKLKIKKLEEALALPLDAATDAELESQLRDIESDLSSGTQRFPGDAHLLSAEASLAELLGYSDRALDALEKAFARNHRNTFIAIRLARCYEKRGLEPSAIDVLRKALEASTTDRGLHFAYATALSATPGHQPEEVLYHLQRSFIPGDSNYEARLLYGRQLFVLHRYEESKAVFKDLKQSPVSPFLRDRVRFLLPQSYHGSVRRLEVTYLFVQLEGTAEWVYCHRNNMSTEVWERLTVGTRLSFSIGFSLRGPSGVEASIDNE